MKYPLHLHFIKSYESEKFPNNITLYISQDIFCWFCFHISSLLFPCGIRGGQIKYIVSTCAAFSHTYLVNTSSSLAAGLASVPSPSIIFSSAPASHASLPRPGWGVFWHRSSDCDLMHDTAASCHAWCHQPGMGSRGRWWPVNISELLLMFNVSNLSERDRIPRFSG